MTINSLQVIAPSTAMPGGPPGVQGPPGFFTLFGVNNQVGVTTYTLTFADAGKMIIFSSAISTVTVQVSPSLIGTAGWFVILKNNNVAALVSLVVTGGTIDGQPTMTIDPKCSAQVVFNGLNFETFGPVDGGTF